MALALLHIGLSYTLAPLGHPWFVRNGATNFLLISIAMNIMLVFWFLKPAYFLSYEDSGSPGNFVAFIVVFGLCAIVSSLIIHRYVGSYGIYKRALKIYKRHDSVLVPIGVNLIAILYPIISIVSFMYGISP